MQTAIKTFTVILFSLFLVTPALSDAAKNQQIDQRIEQVRQQNNLPQKGANGVVWENVARQGDTIVYSYTVPTSKDASWDQNKVRQEIISKAKSDPQIRSDAMKLKFIYTFKGNQKATIVVLPKEYL